MFQEVGRVLYLSECIRSRAIMCAIYYIRRDYPALIQQVKILIDLQFSLEFLLSGEKDYSEDDETYA